VVAFDDSGRVLLVRHSYGPPVWAVPGGGVGRHEEPAVAAAREIREELSCTLSELVAAGSYEDQVRPSRGQQSVFAARLAGAPVADRREIVAVEWFDLAQLPANVSRHVAPLIELAQAARS
jgi:8-oxo-dGTP pyrophosphatase MutT (NUDIX family)